MKHFPAALISLLELEKKTQEELSVGSGVDRTIISRMLRGRVPSREQLAGLVAAISTDQERRVELLLAHLRDEAAAVHARAGLDARHYIIASASQSGENQVTVVPDLVADFSLLADEAARHDDLRAVLSDLSRTILRHRVELADASPVYPLVADSVQAAAEAPPPPVTPAAVILQEVKRTAEREDPPRANKASPARSK